MADFQLSVDLDSRGILSAFRDIEAQAAASGRKVGLGFEDPLNRFGKRSIAALSQELARLQNRQVKLNIDSSAFAKTGAKIREIEGLIQQVNRRQLAINTDSKSLLVMRQRVADLTSDLEKVRVGSPAFQRLKADIAGATKELEKAERAAGQARGAFGGLVQTLAGLGAGAAVIGFFRSSVTEATNLETVTRKLTNTLGANGAAGALDFTRQLSNDLGLSFKTLSAGFASFTAAATAANVPLETQKGLFAAVAKTGQVLGLSNDEISGSLLALQQVASKGTVQMEELRGQLGERMPIAFAATAKGLGITSKELIKLVESGKLTSQQFFPALTKGLNELTGGTGGTRTAAQGFQDLQNAWDNFQTAFGRNVLPAVTTSVKGLTGVINGATGNTKTLIQTFVGLGTAVLVFKTLTGVTIALANAQKGLAVAAAVAQAILNPATLINTAAAIGAGVLVARELGKAMDDAARSSQEYGANQQQNTEIVNQLNAAEQARLDALDAIRTGQIAELSTKQQIAEATGQLAAAEARVAAARTDAAISQLDAVRTYSDAIQSVEQSRFDIARSFNQYELGKLQERGASEGQLRAKRKEGEAIERAALEAKIQQQKFSQQIELQTLAIKQKAARIDADAALQQALAQQKKAAFELDKAQLVVGEQQRKQAIQLAQINQQAADADVQAAAAKVASIRQLQPLEAATVLATQAAAENQNRAAAAAMGYGVAVDGTLVKLRGVVGSFEGLSTATGLAADEQARLAALAQRTGLEAKIAADGTVQIGQAIRAARAGANTLAGSFARVGLDAPNAAASADEFAGFLKRGQQFATGIADTRIDSVVGRAAGQAQGLAGQMGSAARAADQFYQTLARASGLPGARWAGGPVEAGGKYRINDGPGGRSLGQEAFLSRSGQLSLINRPANSLWIAPSDGLVVPAGVTEQLKAAGAVGAGRAVSRVVPRPTGGDPATAALAVEVSRLGAEVRELNRKKWDVHVRLQQDGSGLRMQKLLNGIR